MEPPSFQSPPKISAAEANQTLDDVRLANIMDLPNKISASRDGVQTPGPGG